MEKTRAFFSPYSMKTIKSKKTNVQKPMAESINPWLKRGFERSEFRFLKRVHESYVNIYKEVNFTTCQIGRRPSGVEVIALAEGARDPGSNPGWALALTLSRNLVASGQVWLFFTFDATFTWVGCGYQQFFSKLFSVFPILNFSA